MAPRHAKKITSIVDYSQTGESSNQQADKEDQQMSARVATENV